MKRSLQDKETLQKILKLQCEVCKALAHPLRLAIINRLDGGETAAADLIAELGISKANLSKHMAQLANGGIVESRREGRQIFYRLTDPEIHKACSIMLSVIYRRLKRGEELASAIGSAQAGN